MGVAIIIVITVVCVEDTVGGLVHTYACMYSPFNSGRMLCDSAHAVVLVVCSYALCTC